jgi:hypothetical protein
LALRKAAGLLDGATDGDIRESFGYSVKRRLLGPPMVNEQLNQERLSRPLALGVLSCDGISPAESPRCSTGVRRYQPWSPGA